MSLLKDFKQQYILGGVTEKLIYWNVILFAVPWILTGVLALFGIKFGFVQYISLSSNPADLLWKPWTIISYAFFHAGFLHILFNLIILNFVSRLFMTYFTQKQLLSLYLLGAIFAGFIYIASYLIFPALIRQEAILIGASGAVMAVLFAVAAFNPYMEIRLLLIGRVKIWHIALVYLVIDLISLSSANVGGHIAHLGGALFGYLFSSQIKNGTDITKTFSAFMDYVVNFFSGTKKTTFKKVHKNTTYTTPKQNPKDKSQQQIDAILDKISKSGYDSLTKEEKEFLFKAGKN
ncbi:rhomboid family intramembrane serine protease [Flavobacterium sp.]|jgi:membrane associated rhomboid family serine protease|uniref:rhomboid family intramembrane serine protease n=1 Tax=Flavobacterium sp. TaxID=239 RepID=UPI0037C0CC9F